MNNIMQLIEKLTLPELKKLYMQLEKEIKDREIREKQAAIDQINVIARAAGVRIEVLHNPEQTRKRGSKPGTARIKYRNLETGDSWSGRGREPAWIAELKEKGEDLRDYLTPEFKIPV